MELRRTEQGFALYKEKDCIGAVSYTHLDVYKRQAHSGQTCCHAYHVALGDAAVKVTIRVCLLEHTGLGSGGQIGDVYKRQAREWAASR